MNPNQAKSLDSAVSGLLRVLVLALLVVGTAVACGSSGDNDGSDAGEVDGGASNAGGVGGTDNGGGHGGNPEGGEAGAGGAHSGNGGAGGADTGGAGPAGADSGGAGQDNGSPVAEAGPDQLTPLIEDVVLLDGSASTDPDGDPLSYSWELIELPPKSYAVLSDPTAASPSFVADLAGEYVAELTVNDGVLDSAPDRVSITVRVPPPVVTITAPQNLSVVGATPVNVTGTVSDPNASITVQGVPADNAGGSYAAVVALSEGSNTVTVVAQNGTGAGSASVDVILNQTENPKASITSPSPGFILGEEFQMGVPFPEGPVVQVPVSGVIKVNTSALLPANNKPTVTVNDIPVAAADVTLSPFTGECTLVNPYQCWRFIGTIYLARGARTITVVVTDVMSRSTTVTVSGIVDYCRIGQYDPNNATPGKDPGVLALAGKNSHVQGNRCHEIDGCSGPLGLGLANDPTPLAVCSEGSTQFGEGSQPPAEYFVHGLNSAYNLPCNHHDVCYQTCVDTSQETLEEAFRRCNEEQLAEAQGVCRRAYPNALCGTLSLACVAAGSCAKYLQERASCFSAASVAYQAVSSDLGFQRFQERQSDYCAN